MPDTPTILVASSNPHKIEEIRAVFAGLRAGRGAVELVSLHDLGLRVPEPHEDQPTFEGNAALKARYYAKASGLWCLADDSGLEVDALRGGPGVLSARYAGVSGGRDAVDPANNRKLLAELEGVPVERRAARFVCAMALAMPPGDAELAVSPAGPVHRVSSDELGGIPAIVRGTVDGRILLPEEASDPLQAHRGRGTNGFGYDPLFLLPRRGLTAAELPAPEKNAISHRGLASRLMWAELRRLFAQDR